MSDFELHPELRKDSMRIGALTLCELRLVNDERFPWCLLVPRIADLTDLHDLPTAHRLTLFEEIERVSTFLLEETASEKINVAALGNQVPQLHVHVIGRHGADSAWPNSVWTAGPADKYSKADIEALILRCRERLEVSA
ncbi:MAG: HIT family protein [Pseudomonadota bacterium]